MNTSSLKPLAITPGEPAGIGPDLIVQLAQQALKQPLVVIANAGLLTDRAKRLKLPLKIHLFSAPEQIISSYPGELVVLDVPLKVLTEPGKPNSQNAHYILETLRQAVVGCQQGYFAGLVTGPVNKGVINEAGIPFTGHTEFLAELTKTAKTVMMLVAGKLRVALVTTHIPLSQVSQAITPQRLKEVIIIVQHDARARFGITKPRLIVCGLNPHAGEAGHLGQEEVTVITPVLEQLQATGINLIGPVSADTVFNHYGKTDHDIIIAMYHDQGLPVLKYAGFGQAVNVTLGLPIIRTSVDHGTAFNLAGTGQADTGSFLAAIQLASELK